MCFAIALWFKTEDRIQILILLYYCYSQESNSQPPHYLIVVCEVTTINSLLGRPPGGTNKVFIIAAIVIANAQKRWRFHFHFNKLFVAVCLHDTWELGAAVELFRGLRGDGASIMAHPDA